jgi:3-deoxy-D-manno-octulosonate 8-phosphate phosphatase (KDO 8-P phosphatase)
MIRFSHPRFIPTALILDVDGVLTDRRFLYGKEGKVYKMFGADDHDAIKLMSIFLSIVAVTADKQGFSISKRRISRDFGIEISIVPSESRIDWIEQRFDIQKVIYIGDGFYDYKVFNKVGYGIAPRNALKHTREAANFVTEAAGGQGAVAEACVHIIKHFFGRDINEL